MLQFDTQDLLPWNETALAYVSVVTNGGSNVGITIATYSRYAMGTKEAARSNGVYLGTDEIMTFSLAAPGAVLPKPRDLCTPTSRSARTVLEVTEYLMLKFWRLVVRDVSLSYQLIDVATILRSTPTPQGDGLRQRNVTTLASNVPCRLQLDDWGTESTDSRRTKRGTYTAYLDTPLDLKIGDTIQVSSVQYEVTGQSEIQSLDGLNRTQCERIA